MRDILKAFQWERKGGVKYVIKASTEIIYVQQRGNIVLYFRFCLFFVHFSIIHISFGFRLLKHANAFKNLSHMDKKSKLFSICTHIISWFIKQPYKVLPQKNTLIYPKRISCFFSFLLHISSLCPTAVTEAATKDYSYLKRYLKCISCISNFIILICKDIQIAFLVFYLLFLHISAVVGVLLPNGGHRGCHKIVFVFVRIIYVFHVF